MHRVGLDIIPKCFRFYFESHGKRLHLEVERFKAFEIRRLLHQRKMSEDFCLIYNAKIYSSGHPFNSWMVFNKASGMIDSVGVEDAPLSSFPTGKKMDYHGRLILPGLHDSHLHMEMYGKKLTEIDLKDCRSFESFQKAILDYKLNNPDKKWIIGAGWEQDLLGRFPSSEDIDEVCPDVPVLLLRTCYHIGVVNQKALDIGGFNETTEIAGSELVRYPPDHLTKPNKPTGLLKEIPLILELYKHIPPQSFEERLQNLKVALNDLLKNGITSAHPCEKDNWSEFCHLAENDQLPLRIFYSGFATSVGQKGAFPESSDDCREPMLFASRVKFIVDGALGPLTAAISLPYKCHPQTCSQESGCGMLIYNHSDLQKKVKEAVDDGYRIEAHVIGDRAAELVLDVLDEINLDPSKRPIFVHCQILRDELIERMKKRGVIANIQPQFVNTDARWITDNLPASLMSFAYPWKTLIDRGIPCAGGSDAPVEPPLTLTGIFDAVFRLCESRDVNASPIFRPEERMSIEEAVDIYTKGGAYTALRENDLGELKPGYLADFTVIDRDIFIDPKQALHAKVLETWVNGIRRWIHS